VTAPAMSLMRIHKTFRGSWRNRQGFPALCGVDLMVEPGERVAVIGESGSGKTTLARIGAGLVKADSGEVHLFGENTASWGRRRWHRSRQQAQILFQDPWAMLNPSMTLGVLLTESANLHDGERRSATKRARVVLDEVGLNGKFDAYPSELSGGERRRAGVARLLLAKPSLVIADEPTAGLDAALKFSLLTLLIERLGRDCAVVLISHDLPTVAWASERIVVMRRGLVVDRFPVAALRTASPRDPHTLALLRSAGMPCPPARDPL
jgi:peptide/nickel transport system ATP-binding protein